MSLLSNKVAIITGASSGIGRASAILFAREGASVVVGARRQPELDLLVEEIRHEGGQAVSLAGDVKSETYARALVDLALTRFGGLDIAFNNAGVEQGPIPLADLSEEDFDRLTAIDLRGVFLCMKYQIPLLRERGGGSIVNTSSGAGIVGIPEQAGYVAVKHGVVGMSRSVALEVIKDKIRVNAICPGIIETPMILDRVTGGDEKAQQEMVKQEPIGRMGKPEEIAAAVLYMCSDAAHFMVGHALVIDGGQTAGLSG